MKRIIERRSIVNISATDDRDIKGTAIVFNKESSLLQGMFKEIIKPEAATQDFINRCDIIMVWNHEDQHIPMARSKFGKGTLKIEVTSSGVNFSFKARNTPQGDEILAAVRCGDVDSCSFSFIVPEGGDQWTNKPDGTYLRTVTKFELIRDFSLVNDPAYVEASCRSLDKVKQIEARQNKKFSDSFKSQSEFNAYYSNLEKVIKRFN